MTRKRIWDGITILLVTIAVANMRGQAAPVPVASASGTAAGLRIGPMRPASGLRRLGERGITLQSAVVHDLSRSVTANDQDWFSRYSWDLTAAIDGEKAADWKGGSAALHLKQHRNALGAGYCAPMQGYSNIDATTRTSLYEAWAQQQVWGRRVRLKAGKIDANSDFATVATAADFLNASMGYSPTLMRFPTYPLPKAGVEVATAVGETSQISGGRFAIGTGTFSLVEGAHGWGAGRVSLGAWRLRQKLTRFDGRAAAGTEGAYAVVEQSFWHRPAAESRNERRVAGFLQVGTGQGAVNPYTLHAGGGGVASGMLRFRPGDAVGTAVTWVRLTSASGAGYDTGSEMAAEVYYKVALSRSVSLLSDVQYFQHPGGVKQNGDVVIATPRLVVTF